MPISQISSLRAREVLDSKGNPTIEVELITNLGVFQASAPSGTSKGKYEAIELRDGGKRYQGKGVLKAVKKINQIIASKLKGRDPTQQKEIDNLMIKLDGTTNKSRLGANAILPISMAACRAGARAKNISLWEHISQIAGKRKVSLPALSLNLINGGAHAGNELDFQEFMVVPQVKKISKSLQVAGEIYHELKKIIKKKYLELAINIGDEGGFAPPVRAPEEAIELILGAAKNLSYQNKIKIALDVAASQFFLPPHQNFGSGDENGKYKMKIGVFTSEGLLRYYENLIKKYPILSIEDPFSEEDWSGFRQITKKFGKKNIIFGDDLLVTNPKKIKKAKETRACNGLLLKINQIGTVSEAIEAAKLAQSYGWKIMVSHRSGDTCDSFISDLAVGLGADFIKAGAPARGERVAKYNRLLRIEEEL
ncbi:enolase [Parcubacteria bacterium DG_74_3]|nr:MAG: enolase [Parcubacteria bacterium DG_74_3]